MVERWNTWDLVRINRVFGYLELRFIVSSPYVCLRWNLGALFISTVIRISGRLKQQQQQQLTHRGIYSPWQPTPH